ncbi:MAG: response regulator [Candidatus Eisenbacteria bacterium]|nr:response regulator [Candidatus Eisenbacteria bacterium]
MSTPIRVLFVEDSREDVELVLHELERGGFAVDHGVVDTAPALRAALAARAWDIVIADHSMPRFDAPAALELLKANGSDLPFIVVSGHIGEELAVACMKAGAHDYIGKGHLARLVPAIARELRDAEQRRQRRAAEEALRSSEERYRLLVENAADLITVLDGEGRYVFASPSIRRMLGYEPEALIGTDALDLIHPEDAERVRAAMAEVLGGTPSSLTGLRVRHRDGSWRTIEGSGSRLVDREGRPFLIATARDITERVQLELQLNQSQKMEAVGRLAGGVAHDFNNLLTVILGYGNLLLDQLTENPLLSEEVEEIKRAATRAATLTQQLLAFSRKQVLSLRVLDLNAVVDGMNLMLKRLVGENVRLEMRLDHALGRVKVDPGQIEQVVMNLAVNASDAMPDGGHLLVETSNVELDNSYARRRAVTPGRYVMLAVTDTGIGMDEATQARLFEPFFTTKEPGKGTGLGLSTVYGIVRQCGGNIFVYSEPGKGSSFKIYLPRVDEPAAAREGPPPPRGGTRGTETVLLVEDEPLVRSYVHDVLRKNGYRVLEVPNGDEAIGRSAGHREPIHILVTDVVMPGISGLDLAKQLAGSRPGLRVLYLSGYTGDLVEQQGVLEPGSAFLQKPFTPDALLRKVRELLDAPLHRGKPARRAAARG